MRRIAASLPGIHCMIRRLPGAEITAGSVEIILQRQRLIFE
jgi:hypothetical protein